MHSIVFRPRTATEIVDTTFRICRAHYGALVTAMLVISAPALLLALLPSTAAFAGLFQNLLFTVADGAVIAIVSEIYLGRPAEARTGLAAVRGRIGALIGASMLRGILVMIGTILLVLPGIYILIATFAVPAVIVLERRGVSESLTRSGQLVGHDFWHVLRTLALLFAIVFALILGLGVVLGIAAAIIGAEERLADLVLNISLILLYPLFSVGGTLLYYDLRTRAEGFDLEMMLANLGSAAETGSRSVPGAVQPAG